MRNEDHAHVWTEWHRAASQRDGTALLALYADDAVLESPLVAVVFPDRQDGVLRGRAQIAAFLREGARRLAIPDVRWWRDETWFSSDDTLVWEYPRETPAGDQIDILEVMRVRARLIVSHRIYWGWKGCAWLAGANEKRSNLPDTVVG
jgi:hypothetical protein